MLPHTRLSSALSALIFVLLSAEAVAAAPQDQLERGRAVYLRHCLICHQITGQGMPGSFPPLANSDFLLHKTDESIRAVVAGLSGEITVNGKRYNGSMPPALLKDDEVADVLTYTRQSWGNNGAPITAQQVKAVRAKTDYPTYEALVAANAFAPLPKTPDDLSLRVVGNFAAHPTRILAHPNGKEVWSLASGGDVWAMTVSNGISRQVLKAKDYIDLTRGDPVTYGMTLDRDGGFYVVVNQRNERVIPVLDEVTIFRTATLEEGDPRALRPWFQTNYPWGIGPFNHSVGHIAQGPDGYLYVNSGSRTDGNEPGEDPRYAKIGEHPITACLWRLNPAREKPELEIYARGFRNAYGFCWNAKGEMIATDNGPDADAPEELNVVAQGLHYGFPFQYSDWDRKPYSYTPDPPAGARFARPVINLGPDGGGKDGPISTFHPHSSPAGIVYLDESWAEPYRDGYFLVRFGNLLKRDPDVGFDLLHARLRQNGSAVEGRFKTVLSPLPRPIDIAHGAAGKVYIAEYSRGTNNAASLGFPGRLLELTARSAAR